MRQRREQARKKQQEFKVLAELPEREQEARLEGLAKRLDEDPAAVREEFALSTSSPDPESVELWPEAVETAALLAELIQQLRRFIVFRHDTDATAVALWINVCVDSRRRDAFSQFGRDVARAGLRQEHAARRARTADAPPGQRRRTDRPRALSRCRSRSSDLARRRGRRPVSPQARPETYRQRGLDPRHQDPSCRAGRRP